MVESEPSDGFLDSEPNASEDSELKHTGACQHRMIKPSSSQAAMDLPCSTPGGQAGPQSKCVILGGGQQQLPDTKGMPRGPPLENQGVGSQNVTWERPDESTTKRKGNTNPLTPRKLCKVAMQRYVGSLLHACVGDPCPLFIATYKASGCSYTVVDRCAHVEWRLACYRRYGHKMPCGPWRTRARALGCPDASSVQSCHGEIACICSAYIGYRRLPAPKTYEKWHYEAIHPNSLLLLLVMQTCGLLSPHHSSSSSSSHGSDFGHEMQQSRRWVEEALEAIASHQDGESNGGHPDPHAIMTGTSLSMQKRDILELALAATGDIVATSAELHAVLLQWLREGVMPASQAGTHLRSFLQPQNIRRWAGWPMVCDMLGVPELACSVPAGNNSVVRNALKRASSSAGGLTSVARALEQSAMVSVSLHYAAGQPDMPINSPQHLWTMAIPETASSLEKTLAARKCYLYQAYAVNS
eukprot:365942-Chlamydomonas_euryale.AAC.26